MSGDQPIWIQELLHKIREFFAPKYTRVSSAKLRHINEESYEHEPSKIVTKTERHKEIDHTRPFNYTKPWP